MPRFRFDNPYLLLVLTNLFWSGNWVVGRGFRGEVPPVSLAFWRWTVALLCVLPFAWPHRKQLWPTLRDHWRRVLPLALLGVTAYNTLTYYGLQFTTATNGVLLNSFIPIVIMALLWVFLRKPMTAGQSIGALISLMGVTVIVAHGELASLAALTFNPGDVWIMVSVFIWAIYTILLQFRPAGVHPMALLALLTGLGVLGLAPLYAWEVASGHSVHVTPASLAGIAYTGVFAAFLGYVFWNRAVAQVGSAVAGLFIHLMPVFTPLLSALFLGELPHLYHFAGMALILGGIWLTTRAARKAPA
ncbi:MAG: DMT family transporter [Rhodocyclaceae bacterium]